MFKESKHISLMISMLLVMALLLFACSNGEQESQTADAKAVASEPVEHVHDASMDDSESDAWNRICPVCGGEVTGDLETVTHDAKVYGFGCAGCPEKFEQNPQDYVKNLNEDGTEFIGG